MRSLRSVRGIAYSPRALSRAVHFCTNQLWQIGYDTGFPYYRGLVSVFGLSHFSERTY